LTARAGLDLLSRLGSGRALKAYLSRFSDHRDLDFNVYIEK
jgi:hypothetical protein